MNTQTSASTRRLHVPLTPAPELSVLTLAAVYVAETPVHLPAFAATTFRGALGNALRAISCTTAATTCEGCTRTARCVHGSVWNYARPNPAGVLEDGPKPYTVFSELGYRARTVPPGACFAFGIRLFGLARAHWPALVQALRLAGRAGFGRRLAPGEPPELTSIDGLARLVSVTAHGARDAAIPVYDDLRGLALPLELTPARLTPALAPDLAGRLRLSLPSPLAITPVHRAGEPPPRTVLAHFDPIRFTQLLVDRYTRLIDLHEMRPISLDPAPYLAAAARVRITEDYTRLRALEHFSRAQHRRIPLTGLTGHLLLDDVTPALAGLWRIAESIHVGQQTVKGLGRVRLEPVR